MKSQRPWLQAVDAVAQEISTSPNLCITDHQEGIAVAIRDDTRIGKLPPIAPNEPMPDTAPPDNCEWMRNAVTGRWGLFRKMTDEDLGRQPLPPEQEPDPAIRRVIEEEGARPSSLISVQRTAARDRLYELQLVRDLTIVNERTGRELGPLSNSGMPMQERRKPQKANSESASRELTSSESEAKPSREDEMMKPGYIAALTALTVGTMACQSARSTVETEAAQAGNSQSTASIASNHAPAITPKPRLGPEYKKIESFVEFRKRLLADGWAPVVNPKCHEEMIGADYKEECAKNPHRFHCRICDVIPEMVMYSSQGYLLTYYIKDGVPLEVGSIGDLLDVDEPGMHGLYVDFWNYTFD